MIEKNVRYSTSILKRQLEQMEEKRNCIVGPSDQHLNIKQWAIYKVN